LNLTNNATDSDLPVQTLAYSLNDAPVGMSIDSNGAITWSPGENDGGTTNSIETVVTDGVVSVTNAFTVIVTEVNNTPVAVNDAYSDFGTNHSVTIAAPGVLANDTDSDVPPNVLTAVLVSGPTNGTLILNSTGGFTYTPDYGFSGVDAFTYRASDGLTNSEAATVALTVLSHPLVITSIEVISGDVVVTWDSEVGAIYRVQYRNDLTTGDWNDLSPDVTASGLSTSGTNTVGSDPQRFFRVRLAP
jgi:hypothetical protein